MLESLFSIYNTYKSTYVKDIVFDPNEEFLSKYIEIFCLT